VPLVFRARALAHLDGLQHASGSAENVQVLWTALNGIQGNGPFRHVDLNLGDPGGAGYKEATRDEGASFSLEAFGRR
jgi:hypothetical protein